MKKVIVLISLLFFCIGTGKGVYWAKEGFTFRRIQWTVQPQMFVWNPEADLAIQQPFTYIGRGRQCFAFASQDGKYVLKLLCLDRYQIPFWMRALPFSSREAKRAKRAKREEEILHSFRIASEELREQTGVFALHLGQSAPQSKQLTVIDALGYKYRLPLHKTTFLLQLKQPILIEAFLDALKRGDRAKEERILGALIDVVVDRGKKGIGNQDEAFLSNYGFDGQKGYILDVGDLHRKANGIASIHDTLSPVRAWLVNIDPSLLSYFDQTLEKKLSENRHVQ